MASRPKRATPTREFPTRNLQRQVCTANQPRSTGFELALLKRRNNTGSSRIPSRLAHQARPIRQCWTDPTLSRLLPPSPATPGAGCRQLHPTATTARRRRSLTSIRNNSASWRTARSNISAATEGPRAIHLYGLNPHQCVPDVAGRHPTPILIPQPSDLEESQAFTPLADTLTGNYSSSRDDGSCAARRERVHVPDPVGGGM